MQFALSLDVCKWRGRWLDEAVVSIATANRDLLELSWDNRLSDSTVMAVILKSPRLERLRLDALKITARGSFTVDSISRAGFLHIFLLIVSSAMSKGLRSLECVDWILGHFGHPRMCRSYSDWIFGDGCKQHFTISWIEFHHGWWFVFHLHSHWDCEPQTADLRELWGDPKRWWCCLVNFSKILRTCPLLLRDWQRNWSFSREMRCTIWNGWDGLSHFLNFIGPFSLKTLNRANRVSKQGDQYS